MSELGKVIPLGPSRQAPGPLRREAPEPLSRPAPEPLSRQAPEPLWREVLGRRLRALRGERWETLAQTADRAGISPQYLSEIERGRKEPSSEMIAALAGALDVTVADLMSGAAEDLRAAAATMFLATTLTRTTANPAFARPAHRPSGPVALAA